MQIQLKHIQFNELDYKVQTLDTNITQELKTTLRIGNSFPDENKCLFIVVFDMLLQSKSDEFKLKLRAFAHFSTNQNIEGDFKNSPFIKVNAPAIAFPYIRTFISNLTLNSGYNPLILPAFNFVELAENQFDNDAEK